MTNAEKYKTAKEQYDEWGKFCEKQECCSSCVLGVGGAIIDCLSEWLELEVEEE